MHSEYKDYIRKSLETSRERSLSKREAKHIEKIRESSSKSPRNQEQNLYATKQRYKFSLFNSHSGTNLEEERNSSQPRVDQYNYNAQEESAPKEGTGYILKTDPMRQLLNQEAKKQEYARALRE